MDYIFGASGVEIPGRKLQVRIGPSVENLQICKVNDENDPHFIDSEYFSGNVLVRIKDFEGVTPKGVKPQNCTHYFQKKKRLFAMQVAGRFKHEYTADDILFGATFERKCTPPTGMWIALKFATMIDAGLQTDVYCDKPWLLSPIFCSMNVVDVQKATIPVHNAAPNAQPVSPGSKSVNSLNSSKSKKKEEDMGASTIGPDKNHKRDHKKETSCPASEVQTSPKPAEILGEWVWKGETELKENNELLIENAEVPYANDAADERRKHFQKQKVRKATVLSPNNVYNFEIYAPFINFNTFDVSMGININILRYLNEQPIRLLAKSQSTNQTFFVVEFDLVPDVDGKVIPSVTS
ncbi:hypothetical protein BC833DRAFT_590740 [Globomyces pollinis-pini]|nr:hypothetical protein BC833DRAFT_590740 [Globomyces pollinis-pini]